MNRSIDRRTLLATGATLAAGVILPAGAQTPPTLRFAAVFSDKDIRAEMMKMFAKDIESLFKVEMHLNSTLFRQGTELVALQRDNLEMGNIAPQDISKQVPAWSLLTSAYLFRDAGHLNNFFASDAGAQMKKLVEDPLKVKILGPTFFGTRHVGLKTKKKINVPGRPGRCEAAHAARRRLADAGPSVGANPTPMAYAETYTGLQTGAIDGQDNPLPNVQNMKFYEVMSQIVLTSHLVAFDLLTVNLKTWQGMTAGPAEAPSRPPPTRPSPGARPSTRSARPSWPRPSASRGWTCTSPNIGAFREHAQKACTWPRTTPRTGRPACSTRSTRLK
jgi:TRAP-type C4-dicarboxylate transport system substrate-binding protein